jgi:hypothetical protein
MTSCVSIYGELALISGSGNPELAAEISRTLDVPLIDTHTTVLPEREHLYAVGLFGPFAGRVHHSAHLFPSQL